MHRCGGGSHHVLRFLLRCSPLHALAFAQPLTDDCLRIPRFWAMLFAVFMLHLVLHSGFDVVAFGVAIVDSWPYRMKLEFLPRAGRLRSYLDGAF